MVFAALVGGLTKKAEPSLDRQAGMPHSERQTPNAIQKRRRQPSDKVIVTLLLDMMLLPLLRHYMQ